MHMTAAEVRVKGRFDITTLADFGKHFLKKLLALIQFSGPCHVKVIQPV